MKTTSKPTTGVVVYAALLLLYDQLDQLNDVAAPANDEEGQTLQLWKEGQRKRVRKGKVVDNNF